LIFEMFQQRTLPLAVAAYKKRPSGEKRYLFTVTADFVAACP